MANSEKLVYDDTWSGSIAATSPALLEFDIHYQINTIGSETELTK
jgi:hypothetical protein